MAMSGKGVFLPGSDRVQWRLFRCVIAVSPDRWCTLSHIAVQILAAWPQYCLSSIMSFVDSWVAAVGES